MEDVEDIELYLCEQKYTVTVCKINYNLVKYKINRYTELELSRLKQRSDPCHLNNEKNDNI